MQDLTPFTELGLLLDIARKIRQTRRDIFYSNVIKLFEHIYIPIHWAKWSFEMLDDIGPESWIEIYWHYRKIRCIALQLYI